MGYAAVAGGLHDFVIVCGVEKMTDMVHDETTTGPTTTESLPRS